MTPSAPKLTKDGVRRVIDAALPRPEPFHCAVTKTSSAGRCTTVCVRLTHGGRHCSDDVFAPGRSR